MPPNFAEDQLYRLAICWFPGPHARQRWKWLERFPHPKAAFEASRNPLLTVGFAEETIQRFFTWRTNHPPEMLAETLTKEDIHVVAFEEPDYPPLLKHIHDPPPILFVRGNLPIMPRLAVVGTRHMSPYGKNCVERLVPPLAQAGLAIVSGLAIGIDGCVAQTTVNAKGNALAVLGSGIDDASLYPRQHVRLAHEILANGGAILSEVPPGTDPRPEHFPERNRLISGMSLATLVIEAAAKSGSLITAKCALEQGRDVLAVPGPIWSEGSEGTHLLLRTGAHLCTNPEDVLEALTLDKPAQTALAFDALPLSTEEREILTCLASPKSPDELCRDVQRASPAVYGILTQLEIKNLVKKLDGGLWSRTN